jgi:formate dehydrogenase gamma subunit
MLALPRWAAAQEGIPNDKCMECHSDADLTMEKDGGEVSIFVDEKKLKQSVHAEKSCWDCHKDLTEEHPDNEVAAKPVDCASCHEQEARTFGGSVHGQALLSGQDAAPTCKDCHGSHDVFSPQSVQSPLHYSRQAETCGQCHEAEAEDVAASIHGKATLKGVREAPSCTDCHEEHNLHSLAGSAALREVGDTCSRCHQSERINTKFGMPGDRVKTFFESYHGLALKGGAANAANCASCHGYHKVLPSSDPESTVHKENLVETCGKCHPGAGENFTADPIHMFDDPSGELGAVVNHWVRILYIALIVVVIGSMLLHNFLSWMRALKLWYHARGDTVVRMNLHQRMQHLVLAISFVVLALSGFALKFPESWLAWMFGSDEEIRRWVHRVAGVVMLAGGAWHVVYLLGTRDGRRMVKDFMLRIEDIYHVFWNLLYFVGKRREAPRFRRFGYPEKLEYWAVIWGTIIMGVTGLMIWFKMDVTRWFPRWVVDVAITIHYYEAILACLAILVWHMYHVLFAPGTYPMNFAWWDGKVSRKWLEEEHPLDPDAVEPAEHAEKRDS